MEIYEASPELKEQVRTIISTLMATSLEESSVDLGDDHAVRLFLASQGFGITSIEHLRHRAVGLVVGKLKSENQFQI